MITPALIRLILAQYSLPLHGLHGVSHWARVLEIGQRLAECTGANLAVVRLFAVFHDSRRINEGDDPGHGKRGAELAASLRGHLAGLSDAEFELLQYACCRHTDGLTDADVTVQTCWDADRLDLPRAGIHPAAFRLCTRAARDVELLRWAELRSVARQTPAWVRRDWGVEVRDGRAGG